MTDGYLVLEDGTVFEGQLFGSEDERAGDVVFSTGGVDGYQEMITDPSSKGQIIVLTFPCVGNYGALEEFDQSDRVHANGLVVNELCTEPSTLYGGIPLNDYMIQKGATGISGIDTRELTLKLRREGTMKGAIVKKGADVEAIINDLRMMPPTNFMNFVSPKEITIENNNKDLTIAVIDCGARKGLFEELGKRFNIIRCPYNTVPLDILSHGVNGVVISSGPGSAAANDLLMNTSEAIRIISTRTPILGIGLGAEILAVSLGACVIKMKCGHHGCNQPVMIDGHVCMTSQSHDYELDKESLTAAGFVVTETNLNDGSVEGFRHEHFPLFGYEFHPEGNIGPMDANFIFDKFYDTVKEMRL